MAWHDLGRTSDLWEMALVGDDGAAKIAFEFGLILREMVLLRWKDHSMVGVRWLLMPCINVM